MLLRSGQNLSFIQLIKYGIPLALIAVIGWQHFKIQNSHLKIDRLELQLEQCYRANQNAQLTVDELLKAQEDNRRKRDAALQRQDELIQQLGEIDEQIVIVSEDNCANQPLPNDIRVRVQASN